MERAKQAVSNFISHDGKHTTTVHEDIRKAVTDEHVRPHQHESVTTAIDKEVHQDHHHTTIQPIKAKEILPEKHTHNAAPVEHRTIEHGNERSLRANLERDAAKYKDNSVVHSTTRSTENAAAVSGEHIHHHVHEHVQPVIQKETIQPHVVHTTIPIHETHHAEAVHHGTSTLPVKTLEEFRQDHGVLEGRGMTKVHEYEGCPKTYNRELQNEQLDADKSLHMHAHPGSEGHSHREHTATGGQLNDRDFAKSNGITRTAGLDGTSTGTSRVAATSNNISSRENGRESDLNRVGTHASSTTAGSSATKVSLADKLNPFKDADGDGKKGILD